MARHRFEYVFRLKNFTSLSVSPPFTAVTWRNPSLADYKILADLMLDSYRHTIDYDGETIEDAMREVESYFSRLEDSSWLKSSWLAFAENNLVSASLVGFWNDRNSPIIAYVMTTLSWKGKHLATTAVSRSLQSLAEDNHTKVYAVITKGNTPSEKVFARLQFERVASTQ